MEWSFQAKLLAVEYHRSFLVMSQHWFLTRPNHYLSRCSPRFISPYGFAWPTWVNRFIACASPERYMCPWPKWFFNAIHNSNDLFMIWFRLQIHIHNLLWSWRNSYINHWPTSNVESGISICKVVVCRIDIQRISSRVHRAMIVFSRQYSIQIYTLYVNTKRPSVQIPKILNYIWSGKMIFSVVRRVLYPTCAMVHNPTYRLRQIQNADTRRLNLIAFRWDTLIIRLAYRHINLQLLWWNIPRVNTTERFNHKSTLLQVLTWCRKATRHYLNRCWPSNMMAYGVTGSQWLKARGNVFFIWPRLNLVLRHHLWVLIVC